MTDERWIDPELDDLFAGEPELRSLADRLREARPEPVLDERFPGVLRAQLMREAQARVPSPAARAARDARRPRSSVPRRRLLPWGFGWNAAGVGVAFAAIAAIVLATTRPSDHTVTAISPVADVHAVSPDNVITVAFSQPMDHAAVLAGLHITPATEVTTSWNGNNLVITPTHHLAGNTSYTVTIDQSAARSSSGATPSAPIIITFGTAPTPPPAPAVATLSATALGPADPGSTLIGGPNGSVIAGNATASATAPSAVPSISPTTSNSKPTPLPIDTSPTPSATAAAASPAAGTARPSIVRFNPDGSSVPLGSTASILALSPDGLNLVSAVSQNGSTQVVLTSTDGQQHSVLTTVNGPVLGLGWFDFGTVLVAESDHVESVSLDGTTTALAALPPDTTTVRFSAIGGALFAGSDSADGQLLDSHTGQGHVLPGSRTDAAFSGNGQVVAWIDDTGTVPQLMTSSTSNADVAQVPIAHPGDTISDVALDASGDRIAFIDEGAPADSRLVVEQVETGTPIAQGTGVAAPVFLGDETIGFLTPDGNAALAALPTSNVSVVPALPADAATALQAFVDAQAKGDNKAMTSLAGSGVDITQTPSGLSRGFVISAVANSDGSITATARLIVDASGAHPVARSADETLTLGLNTAGTGYVVTALSIKPLVSVSAGPHVLRVVPSVHAGKLALLVTFDCDLTDATVAQAITVTTAGGTPVTSSTTYDADSHTATVIVDATPGTLLHLMVATSLKDADGAALASAFTTTSIG